MSNSCSRVFISIRPKPKFELKKTMKGKQDCVYDKPQANVGLFCLLLEETDFTLRTFLLSNLFLKQLVNL